MLDVMIDLETMGTSPNAAIVAIGAVEFDPDAGELGERFYSAVSLTSSVRNGMRLEPETVLWWMKQSEAARAELSRDDRLTLPDALVQFARWVAERDGETGVRVWGNGAAFDNVVLGNAYRQCRLPQPWQYRNDRCYRTLRGLRRDIPTPANDGTAHHALDDAVSQAQHAILLIKAVRGAAAATTEVVTHG